MKVPEGQQSPISNNQNQFYTTTHHPYVTASLVIFGFGVLAIATFWLRKCKSSSAPRHEYSALRLESAVGDRCPQTGDRTSANWQRFAAKTDDRYEFRNGLPSIGSRAERQWYVVRDKSLDADRLLTVTPLPSTSSISAIDKSRPSPTRETFLKLFRALQHPYVHPILDVEFLDVAGVALIAPVSAGGSLKDLIRGTCWYDDYTVKYRSAGRRRGKGLHIGQIQCLGRQILEALLFLKSKNYPRYDHLHSGNVMIQHGVARLAGLENALFGFAPAPSSNDATAIAFGRLLYEMASGCELDADVVDGSYDCLSVRFKCELERLPMVADVLCAIFERRAVDVHDADGTASWSFEEDLLRYDLFRGVELRELRGIRYSNDDDLLAADVQEVLECCRMEAVAERNETIVIVESRQLEDIAEAEEDELKGS